MTGRKILTASIFLIISITAVNSFAQLNQRRLERELDVIMLADYFDNLVSGNLESARYLWTDEARRRAEKFGISYTDIPLKVDCNSPIVRDIETMKYHLVPPVKMQTRLTPSNFSKLDYSATIDGKEVTHSYYATYINEYNWLTYAQDYYCLEWPEINTKYFNIRYHPSLKDYLNDIVLDEADRYVEAIADSLDYSQPMLKKIEEKKITYFLCESDDKVKDITGHMIKGTFDLPSNDVISSFFPHYHEIDHFMVNYKLQRLPLYTLPLFREGVAVKYGGRWGKTPASLLALGGFLYKENVIEFDSILTMIGFDKYAGADLAYPVAGLFSSYLIDKIGIDKYFELYLEMSGKFLDVRSLTAQDVIDKIVAKTGAADWDELKNEFAEYIDKSIELNSGLLAGGFDKKGKTVLTQPMFEVYENDDWLALAISSDEGKPKGNILFGKDEKLSGKQSALFNEQYKGELPFEGYRYGIRYDTNEAGIYDYATNHLLAKYIWGITPSENYYKEDANKLYIMFPKNVTETSFDKAGDYMVLPQ